MKQIKPYDQKELVSDLVNLTKENWVNKSFVGKKEEVVKLLLTERMRLETDSEFSKNAFAEKLKNVDIMAEVGKVKLEKISLLKRIMKVFGL